MALIVGTVTNVCCECTARDAAMRNFKTIMISDANASRNDAEHNATLSIFLQAFGGVQSEEGDRFGSGVEGVWFGAEGDFGAEAV